MTQRVAARYLARVAGDTAKYTGVFLTPMAKQALLKRFPPVHPEVHADHMTIWSMMDSADSRVDQMALGQTVAMKVLAYFVDDKGQAVRVETPKGVHPRSNRIAHITISTAAGVPPKYSNKLVRDKSKRDEDARGALPTLKGKLGWYDGSRVRYALS